MHLSFIRTIWNGKLIQKINRQKKNIMYVIFSNVKNNTYQNVQIEYKSYGPEIPVGRRRIHKLFRNDNTYHMFYTQLLRQTHRIIAS